MKTQKKLRNKIMSLVLTSVATSLLLGTVQTVSAKEIPFSEIALIKEINEKPLEVAQNKKYQVLYFWASWCPSCKEKMKGPLNEVNRLPETSLFLVNTEKDINMVKNFVQREEIALPVLMDADKKLRKLFDVNPVPHWVLLKKEDQSFQILGSEVGWDLDKIKELIGKN